MILWWKGKGSSGQMHSLGSVWHRGDASGGGEGRGLLNDGTRTDRTRQLNIVLGVVWSEVVDGGWWLTTALRSVVYSSLLILWKGKPGAV